MADNLQLSRDTKVYLDDGTNIWRLPVLDGFSFSQSTTTSEVGLKEMSDSSGTSRRGRAMFTDALNPAEWSFSLYARGLGGVAVDEALWANFTGQHTYSSGNWDNGVTRTSNSDGTGKTEFDFDESNSITLGTFNLYFVLGACGNDASAYSPSNGQTIYKISNCVANTASIDFDIDGIATVNWSGFGTLISEETSYDASAAIETGISSTSNFIRNRLTQLVVAVSDLDQDDDSTNDYLASYSITLTGGSVTFENGITYLTPEELCRVNTPLGHVTGTRSVMGNFTCYLSSSAGASADLFDDLITATGVSTNSFALTFNIGGTSTYPGVSISVPTAHLEIPTHAVEDVISMDVAFHGLPTTLSATNEATVTYWNPAS